MEILWNKCFSLIHMATINGTLYSILFETSICQFNSSTFSPIMPDEVREHLTRDQDHSFIQNHSRPFRFTAPWRCLLLFSSLPFTHFLQGSVQRTGMAIAEAWFCEQWPIFCVVFEICVWIIVRLEDPIMAHSKISNRVSHLLIFICWYLIESMMPRV